MPIGLAVLIIGVLYFADKHGKLKQVGLVAGVFVLLYALAHC